MFFNFDKERKFGLNRCITVKLANTDIAMKANRRVVTSLNKNVGRLSYISITVSRNLLNACNKNSEIHVLEYWSCVLDCILGRFKLYVFTRMLFHFCIDARVHTSKICRHHLKILVATCVTWSKSHTQYPQILGATVQNLVARATWRLEFVHRCMCIHINKTII
jgi:hypothetical protein